MVRDLTQVPEDADWHTFDWSRFDFDKVSHLHPAHQYYTQKWDYHQYRIYREQCDLYESIKERSAASSYAHISWDKIDWNIYCPESFDFDLSTKNGREQSLLAGEAFISWLDQEEERRKQEDYIPAMTDDEYAANRNNPPKYPKTSTGLPDEKVREMHQQRTDAYWERVEIEEGMARIEKEIEDSNMRNKMRTRNIEIDRELREKWAREREENIKRDQQQQREREERGRPPAMQAGITLPDEV